MAKLGMLDLAMVKILECQTFLHEGKALKGHIISNKQQLCCFLAYNSHIIVAIFFSVTVTNNKKRAWSWPAYLEEERAIAAPIKLFKEV